MNTKKSSVITVIVIFHIVLQLITHTDAIAQERKELRVAFEEFLTIFPVLWVGVHLIHQSVLLSVLLCRPIWDLVNEPP